MAQNAGSASAPSGGFAQNSGGYYILTGSLTSFAKNVVEGTGSGGATTAVTVSDATIASPYPSTILSTAGRLIKDMGRHVFSAGRAFRKFQAVDNGAGALNTSGVAGTVAGSNAGYITFYLEMPKGTLGPNSLVTTFPPIAKFS